MYVVGPYPNNVFALDATTGDLKWSYRPGTSPSAQGVACCDVVARGLGYDNGKIFLATSTITPSPSMPARARAFAAMTTLGDISSRRGPSPWRRWS